MQDKRVDLNGVKVYPFASEKELLDYVDSCPGILVAINAEKILHANDQTRAIINRNIGYCDGSGAVMALKQKGYKEVRKIAGCELWLKIIQRFLKEKTFYLVGSKPQVIEETVAKLKAEYPEIHIVGYRDGYLKSEQERYKYQLELLRNNLMGDRAQDFELRLADGSKKKLSEIEGKMLLVFFNDEECEDCTIGRLRLSTDVKLNALIDAGEITFVCVYMGKYTDEWAKRAAAYHNKWIIGANDEVADKYDLRIQPSIYILDKDKIILDKNINVEGIKTLLN